MNNPPETNEKRKIWTLIVSSFVVFVIAILSLPTCGLSAISAAMGLGLGLYARSLIKDLDGTRNQIFCARLGTFLNGIIVLLTFLSIIIGGFFPMRSVQFPNAYCRSNLHQLAIAIKIYTDENEGKYPTPEIWCDLLQKSYPETKEILVCPSALEEGDKEKSHFAINPNCEPNSPYDMVLIFETKGGWNQQGGLELLTTKNHGGKGCNILFKDWSARFIKTEELESLKWKP